MRKIQDLGQLKSKPKGCYRAYCFCYGDKIGTQGQLERSERETQQRYGQLTDNDLSFSEGKEDELLGRLQQKLGKTKEALRDEIEKL